LSRSYRRTPIFGITTSRSEKQDKRFANRRLRRKVKSCVVTGDEELPLLREVSNVWTFDKDGKAYWSHGRKKDMRK
jgi:hypothetical protein